MRAGCQRGTPFFHALLGDGSGGSATPRSALHPQVRHPHDNADIRKKTRRNGVAKLLQKLVNICPIAATSRRYAGKRCLFPFWLSPMGGDLT